MSKSGKLFAELTEDDLKGSFDIKIDLSKSIPMDEETLEYREYANTLVQAHDIAKFAKEQMGIELYPFQVEMVQHILSGNIMIGGRRFGKHTAVRVAKKYAKAQNG